MSKIKLPTRKTPRNGVTPSAQRRAKRVPVSAEAVTEFHKALGNPVPTTVCEFPDAHDFPDLSQLSNKDKGRVLADDDLVERLYQWYKKGGHNYREVADLIGVGERTIWRAFSRREKAREEKLDALLALRHVPSENSVEAEGLMGQIAELCMQLHSLGVSSSITYAPLNKRSRANV